MKLKIFCRCSVFLPGRAKDLSAPLVVSTFQFWLKLGSHEPVSGTQLGTFLSEHKMSGTNVVEKTKESFFCVSNKFSSITSDHIAVVTQTTANTPPPTQPTRQCGVPIPHSHRPLITHARVLLVPETGIHVAASIRSRILVELSKIQTWSDAVLGFWEK